MRVYKLAQQLNISSKKVLDAILELNISATSHQSSLSEDEVKRIIQYFEKNKRAGLLFNKSFLSIYEVIKSSLKQKSFAIGLLIGIFIFTIFGFSLSNNDESQDAVDESQKINNITSTTIEVINGENNSQDLSPPLFTDEEDSTTTTTSTVPTTTVPTTTTTTVPTTTTTTVPTSSTSTTTVPTTTTTTVPTTVLTKYLVVGGNCSYSIVEVSESDEQFLSGMTLEEATTTRDEFNTWRCAENSTTTTTVVQGATTTTTTTVPVSTNYTFEQSWYNTFTSQYGIDIDSSKNLYVAGMNNRFDTTIGTQAVPSGTGMIVYKLNHLGDLEWLKTFGNSEDIEVNDIAVDQNGNSIITGYFDGSLDFGTGMQTAAGLVSSFVLKLDPNGETEWVFTPTNSSNMADVGMRVDTDSSGNIYMGGYISDGNTPYTVSYGSFTVTSRITNFYLKLNSNGVVQWVKTLDTGMRPASVFVDSEDNKYLSGHCLGSGYGSLWNSTGPVTFSNAGGDDIATLSCSQQVNFPDVYVIKLDSSDNYVWHWNDFAYGSASAEVISNSNGDVYVSYYIHNSQPSICGTNVNSGTQDYFNVLVKLDSTGTCQWFYRTENPVVDRSPILRLGLDSNNNIYFRNAQKSLISNSTFKYIYVFNDQGILINPAFSENYIPYDFVFDSDDNFYSIYSSEVIKRTLSDLE